MNIDSLRDLTKDELLQRKDELRQEMYNLQIRKGVRELDNPLKIRTLRRDLARVETILSEDRQNIRRIVDQTGLLDSTDAKKSKES